MHPIVVIVPAVALLLGPRLWVETVRRRHDRHELEGARTGGELARDLLDQHNLTGVQVDRTDIGDHYDPQRKAVRLTRDNYERRSVAALVTAAHEVGHALQDASDYPPFRWRADLVRLARATAEVGSVLLIATPLAAFVTRSPVPPIAIGSVALAVIGTGVTAQLAALPTELDASFRRALPLLQGSHLHGSQIHDARQMLLACSLTYVASSLAAALALWPWLPRRTMMLTSAPTTSVISAPIRPRSRSRNAETQAASDRTHARPSGTTMHQFVRRFGKPLIRGWYQARSALTAPVAPGRNSVQ